MDTTLVTVTLLSMAMAASLSVIVWRMLRDERKRSEARVLALTAAAARPSSAAPRAAATEPHPDPAPRARTRASRLAPRTSDLDWRSAKRPARVRRRDVRGARRRVAVGPSLRRDGGSRPRRRERDPLFADRERPERRAPRPAPPARPPRRSRSRAPAAAAGLELLSLRDSRQPGSLTITGLVQNPARRRAAVARDRDRLRVRRQGGVPGERPRADRRDRARARRRVAVRRVGAGHAKPSRAIASASAAKTGA